MTVLDRIPFSLDSDALAERLHVHPSTDDGAQFARLVELATDRGRPKAVYRAAYVESIEGAAVTIDGITFTSRMLAKNLASVGRVFAFVSTCGTEMDEVFDARDDILQEFWWDNIKQEVLRNATRHLNAHLESRFRLSKTAGMSPGSGDATVWPIEQQEPLFALIGDVEGAVGVRLTDSCLMIPNKTVSGVRFQAEKDFRACQVCHRQDCPGRGALFDKELWESIQHE